MAYVFRIHDSKQPGDPSPASASSMSGWSQTTHIAGGLLGNITVGVQAGKMGTSIPSVFARLFLFESAFQTMRNKPFGFLNQINIDTSLISECLDLIEFVYQHGNDKRLVIKHWNVNSQIGFLNGSLPEHRVLAKVLSDEITVHPELSNIFLFYWKDSTPDNPVPHEILIGGTSPYTMVFTSPNWIRKKDENGFSFNRLDGSKMFGQNDIKSLFLRDGDFKNMLYSLRMAYPTAFGNNSFCDYITTMWNNDVQPQEVVNMGNNPAAFLSRYTFVRDVQGANVMAGAIPVCYENIVPTASGYEIRATVNRYSHYVHNGTNIQIQTPLVLNDHGIKGIPYVGRAEFNAQSCNINEALVRVQKLHERTLPGQMGVKYPFLIWSDFLEDKIIKLPYNQNSRFFITGFDGNTNYLLPLKREFFKYFNVADINSIIGTQNRKLVDIRIGNNEVTVTLNIPIADPIHRTIELQKVYKDTDIVSDNQFVVAFFPFYKCLFRPELDNYSVMTCGKDVVLNFFKMSNLDNELNVVSEIRTPNGAVLRQTEYYKVNENFDLVEITCGNSAKGLILPRMKEVEESSISYSFAIDFGTSNTYVAYSTNIDQNPKSLEVTSEDVQTVYLNEEQNTCQLLVMMKPYFDREFMPVQISKDASVAFPMRTSTCEVSNFESVSPELFSKISIGFNMQSEQAGARNNFVYKTGLKWLLEHDPGNIHHTNRIKFFFTELLWILKNKALLNEGSDTFNVYVTFPETMKAPTKTALMNQWNAAKESLNLNCTFYYGSDYSESISPYNSLATKIGGDSFLNMDIGGGTNDLLFVCKNGSGRIEAAYYSSSMFAADDLWGDGIVIGVGNGFNNGFVNEIDLQIQDNVAVYPQNIISNYNSLKLVTESSADIMGFLFKHDAVFNTSAKIVNNRKLYSLVFVHYAALIYHVSRLIKKLDMEIPTKFSFTGMGSKYINLISPDNLIIKELTVLLLEKFTGQSVPVGFTVLPNGNQVKEVTAKGALLGETLNPNFKIEPHQLRSVVDYGFDGVESLTYEDISSQQIRDRVLGAFADFINTLKGRDFANFLFNKFGITIPEKLFDDLIECSRQSFVTMSASIPAQYRTLNVTETLFFWSLKNSFVELSRRNY